MSEKLTLEPREFGVFVTFMGQTYVAAALQARTKIKDMGNAFGIAIALGLLLAKRQPELTDACIQYWNLRAIGTPDDYLDDTLTLYQHIKDEQSKGA